MTSREGTASGTSGHRRQEKAGLLYALELSTAFRTPGSSAPTLSLLVAERGQACPSASLVLDLGHEEDQDWGTGMEGICIH